MTASRHVTVVVPNRDRAALLDRCLASLRAQRHRPFDVVVVDNGSSDGSVEVARRALPDVRVVLLGKNRGFAVAANAGARLARGPYVAFLNNDATAEPEWLTELVACLERHPTACAATARVLCADDPTVLDGAGDALTHSLKAYRRGFGAPAAGRYVDEEAVFGVSGTASLWRTDVFARLGGFDEAMFAYYEDVDLSLRARMRGHECWYAPRAVAHHVGGATAASDWAAFETFHSVVNRWRTIVRSVPAAAAPVVVPLAVAGEMATAARAISRGDWRILGRAYLATLRALPDMFRSRHSLPADRLVGPAAFLGWLDGAFPPLRVSRRRFARPHGAPSPSA